jgi:hypothetical protein
LTIIGTAVCNDLDVGAYLQDVLIRALAGETNWALLAPHAWKTEHPESIRQYRQEERRQAAGHAFDFDKCRRDQEIDDQQKRNVGKRSRGNLPGAMLLFLLSSMLQHDSFFVTYS